MPKSDPAMPGYAAVDTVLGAVADWVNRYRDGTGRRDEFGQCEPEEVMRIARDLGMREGELREIASKGPGAADLLNKMLVALQVDPKSIETTDLAVMRDLQRVCITCGDKTRCRHELADGTAADHFHEYCPNAFTLDALFKDKAPKTA